MGTDQKSAGGQAARQIDRPAVLVTRPAGVASEQLLARLQDAGFKAYSQPLLELAPIELSEPQQRQAVQDLDTYQHVIFISTNAVRFGMERLEAYWPQLPIGPTWYGIGDATAQLLQEYGVPALNPGKRMTSEGLLDHPKLRSVAGEKVLLVKGLGGRELLATTLRERGARVDELCCYKRLCPDLKKGELAHKIATWNIEIILISSGEGLANLQVLLSPAETSTVEVLCLIVPSERTARLARAAGFRQVVAAENASDVAMLRALEDWQSSSGE